MPKITQEQAEELLYVAKQLCSNRCDELSGCEGCWLFDWEDETGEHPCEFKELQDEIEKGNDMYNTDRLYVLIIEQLAECVDMDDYELKDVEEYEWDMMEYENDIKIDILCNNDFDWYGKDGRKILADYTDCYEGHSYEVLAKALTDIDFAIDIIWKARFDEAIEDLMQLFMQYHK